MALPRISTYVYEREMRGSGRWKRGMSRYQAVENVRSAKVKLKSRQKLRVSRIRGEN